MIRGGTIVAALATLLALAAPPVAAQSCKRYLTGEWPVRLIDGRPVVTGSVNGKRATVFIHTGSLRGMVTSAAAKRLGLPTQRWGDVMKDGEPVYAARVDELRLGSTTIGRGWTVRVEPVDRFPGVDVVLGVDFLESRDLEFDLPAGFIRAYRPAKCEGDVTAGWAPGAGQAALNPGREVSFPAKVKGRDAIAVLNTTGSGSLLSKRYADKIGLDRDAPGVRPAGCIRDAPSLMVSTQVQVGSRVDSNARLYIHDVPDIPGAASLDLVLGTDFLRTHRVLVALKQGVILFSYVAGEAFTAVPTLPCDPPRGDKNPDEYRKSLDEVLGSNPRNAGVLVQRGYLRSVDEPKEALADLDAAVAIRPADPLARVIRSNVRAAIGDDEGALADTAVALEGGFRNAQIYAKRSQLRSALGDEKGALEESQKALDIDPTYTSALVARGELMYRAARFEEAERDFHRVTIQRDGSYDLIWLALIRMRLGVDARSAIDEGLMRLDGDEWPAPVLRHLQGRVDIPELLAKAEGAADKDRAGQVCEANYYAGARLLVDRKRDEARPYFERARAGCPRDYREYVGAVAELGENTR